MKCRFHPCDPGRVGLCASCLRERLEALVAERERRKQAYSSSLVSAACQSSVTSYPDFPLSFPRSVSPYVSARDRESLFFSTPQLNLSKKNHHQDIDRSPVSRKEKRFSLFSAIFGRRKPSVTPAPASSSFAPSSSWLSSMMPVRHKKSRLFPAAAAGSRNSSRRRDCRMPPVATGRDDEVSADETGCVPAEARGSRLKPDASVRGGRCSSTSTSAIRQDYPCA